MSTSLCDSCAGLCCRYFALPLDNPSTAREYDDIRWYLCHENVCVFIEEKQWYIGISNRCKHLLSDNRCGIYATRPEVCREYATDNCDFHGGEYNFEKLFTSAEQLRVYAEEKLKEAAEKRRKRKRAAAKAKQPAKRRRPALKANLRRMRQGIHGDAAPAAPPTHGNGNGRTLALPLLRR